jgi:hypothetical protein
MTAFDIPCNLNVFSLVKMLLSTTGLYQSSTNPRGYSSMTSEKSRLKSANIPEFVCQYSPLSFCFLHRWRTVNYILCTYYITSDGILRVVSCMLRECNEVAGNQLQRRGQKRVLFWPLCAVGYFTTLLLSHTHVRWFPSHHSMGSPGLWMEGRPPLYSVATNILNRQQWISDTGWSSRLP